MSEDERGKILSAILENVQITNARLTKLKEDMNYVKGDIANIKRKLEQIDARFDANEKYMKEKFAEIDARFEKNEKYMQEQFALMNERFNRLEIRYEQIAKFMNVIVLLSRSLKDMKVFDEKLY